MGQIVVNVGSFDLTSHNGNTAYSTTKYFDIPANAGITGCVATFATHVNTGNFQGKSFSLNGAQAHPNTPWPTTNISLNAALLSAGQNTFRAAVKSQAGLSARWSIGDIYLTITYADYGGGGEGPPVGGGGPVVVTPSSIDAGAGSVTVTCPAEAGIWHMIDWTFGSYSGSWSHPWEAGGTKTINIPLSWISEMPSATQGTLAIRVRRSTTPAMPYSYATDQTTNVTIKVPASVVPTIGTFTASLNNNGVDASITEYVQNYNKVNLAMGSVAGALGSSIASYVITGGGKSAATKTTTFGPFSQTGNITFTAKVTDTRGRTATKTVTINMLAYSRISGKSISAYRSNGSSVADDEGAYVSANGTPVFSSLGGQNAATIKGRVYEKGATPGSWVSMTSGAIKLFGGTYSAEKGYTAEISINDKITSTVYTIQIPTATVGIHIMPGVTGMGLGEYAESGKLKVSWPIYADGNRTLDERNLDFVRIALSNYTGVLAVYDRAINNDYDTSVYVKIEGLTRTSGTSPILTIAQGYWHRTSGWEFVTQKNLGYSLAAVKLMSYEGNLGIYISGLATYGSLKITLTIGGGVYAKNTLLELRTTEPAGSNKVTCTIV